jgi:large subunit ribosomal protein L6
MSRIGKQPVLLPRGVEITRNNGVVQVKGPKGTLQRALPAAMELKVEEGRAEVLRPSDSKEHRSLHGLTRTLVANMVQGVTEGYTKTLEIQGVGYRAAMAGKKLNLSVGYSHGVEVIPKDGITLEVGQETNTRNFFIKISGIDKEVVGQQAAEIRSVKKPEPYKGKGIRYQGEQVRRKAGKTAKGGKGK